MNTKTVQWVLRVAVAGTFIGHGLLATGGKADWISWFAKFGVADPMLAKQLLLGIGIKVSQAARVARVVN